MQSQARRICKSGVCKFSKVNILAKHKNTMCKKNSKTIFVGDFSHCRVTYLQTTHSRPLFDLREPQPLQDPSVVSILFSLFFFFFFLQGCYLFGWMLAGTTCSLICQELLFISNFRNK